MIGKGAFAKVCLGIQILTGAKVAMKIIEKSTLKTESAKKRLLLVKNLKIIYLGNYINENIIII